MKQINDFKSIHIDLEKGIFELNGEDIGNDILLHSVDAEIPEISITRVNGKWTCIRNLVFVNSQLDVEIEEKKGDSI